MNCTHCGTPLPQEVAYCPRCGTPTPALYSAAGAAPNAPTVASSPAGTPMPLPPNDYGHLPYGLAPPSPYSTPPLTPPPPPPKRRVKTSLFLVAVVLVAFFASIGVFAFLAKGGANRPPANASTTATASPIITTTTMAVTAPYAYPSYLPGHGTLSYHDSLATNDSAHLWGEGGAGGQSCTFMQEAYHVLNTQAHSFYLCGRATVFSDFAFEVQMKILRGDCGGIGFRAKTTTTLYRFDVCSDGTYLLTFGAGAQTRELTGNTSAAIHSGLNQINVLAVVARGSTITLYANQQQLSSVTDQTNNQGFIGVLAENNGNSTEAAYQNASTWTF